MFNLDEEWIDAKIILSCCNKPFFHLSHRNGLELVVDLVGYKKDLYDMVSTMCAKYSDRASIFQK